MDIAPTVLYLHSLPIPSNMDGQPMKGLLTSSAIERLGRPVKGADSTRGAGAGGAKFSQDASDEELITERLRGLGYI
jgi:arylsulfatase A-like enzyme